jgi:MFS family permease
MGLMNLSVYTAAPFFIPYMLKDLQLNYLLFTIITCTAIVVKVVSMPVWGKASDQFGTRKILVLCGYLMPIVPVLWLFSKDIYFLILIQAYGGFVWAGFELAGFNFVFDATTPQKRVSGIAYLNVLNGIGVFAGSLIGALIVKYNALFWSKYFAVFLLSGILRLAATFICAPKLKEVRIVKEIPYSELFFKIIRTMPTAGVVFSSIPFRKKTGHDRKSPT